MLLIKSKDTKRDFPVCTVGTHCHQGLEAHHWELLKNVSDNILKSLHNFTAIKKKYVDLAHSQWEDELQSFVQFEGVKFAQWEDQLKGELQYLKHEK